MAGLQGVGRKRELATNLVAGESGAARRRTRVAFRQPSDQASRSSSCDQRHHSLRAWLRGHLAVGFGGRPPFAGWRRAAAPAFVASYQCALAINDVITAVLLRWQFALCGWR